MKTFEHVPSEIGAEEAEEVGVEHLLRDMKDQTAGTLSQRITEQLMGLRGLKAQLEAIHLYLHQVIEKKLPVNHQITHMVQVPFFPVFIIINSLMRLQKELLLLRKW